MKRRYDICAAVVSDLPYDARVWKEARSLATAGHTVVMLGCRYGTRRTRARRDEGIDVLEVGLGERGGTRAWLLLALARLWFAILRCPARSYHAHNIHTVLPALVAARLRGSFLVYDAHELYGQPGPGRGLRAFVGAQVGAALERLAVRAADAVITTNPSRADELAARHGRRDVWVLANVPPLVEVVEPLDPGYPVGRPVLLYQGGIYPESRAFAECVEALRQLPEVDLVLLGFGRPAMLETIRRLAEDAGVADRVHLLPPRPFRELVSTAAAATIGLVPIRPDTLNERLGDTNKLFEYLMAGLPVAASELPEIARVVREGSPQVGELFDPSSPGSIASAVLRLLADTDLYRQRRAEARRLACERYNWQAEEPRLLALYEGLLEPVAHRAPASEGAVA